MRTVSTLLLGAALLGLGCWGDPAEGRFPCNDSDDCPAAWHCRSDDRCWSTLEVADAGRRDSGVDAYVERPPACNDGVISDPSLEGMTAVLGGDEVITLPPMSVGLVSTPAQSGSPIFPALSLALSGVGYGVMGTIVSGDVRQPALLRFRLDDWSDAFVDELPTATAVQVRAFAVGPALLEDRLVGIGLASPVEDGGIAGFGFTSDFLTADSDPISAGSPANVPLSQAAVAGGYRSFDGATTTAWLVTRERLATGEHILGATNSIGLGQYRTTLTGAFPMDDLVVSGSPASELVLIQDPVGLAMAVWDVSASFNYTAGPRTDDVRLLEPVTPAAGIAAIEADEGSGHVLAVPVGEEGGGAVDLYVFSALAPDLSGGATSRVSVPGGEVADQVDLVRLVGGFALVISDVESGAVYLRLLDRGMNDVSPSALDTPWFALEPNGTTFIAGAASVGAGAMTLVLGSLRSDAFLGTSVLHRLGYRACDSR